MPLDTRRCFWFGTEDAMTFFKTPTQGADSSPQAWGANGTLLNGGGWAMNSFGSHKQYTYEWGSSSSPEVAQKMKSYYDGTYGRGLLYFIEPTIFETNVLPAHWADPSMSLDNEAPSLVYGKEPVEVLTSGGADLGLPVRSAQYTLSGSDLGPSQDNSVFIPIPEGFTLVLGAIYSASNPLCGVYAQEINSNGTWGDLRRLNPLSPSGDRVLSDLNTFSGLRGIRLWVGSTFVSGTVTLTALTGRLIETKFVPVTGVGYGDLPFGEGPYGGPEVPAISPKFTRLLRGPWVGGQGHSGCRFAGPPTYVTNSPTGGGRVGFAATFKEVGSWVYG